MAASLEDPGSIPGGGPKRFHESFNIVFCIVGECNVHFMRGRHSLGHGFDLLDWNWLAHNIGGLNSDDFLFFYFFSRPSRSRASPVSRFRRNWRHLKKQKSVGNQWKIGEKSVGASAKRVHFGRKCPFWGHRKSPQVTRFGPKCPRAPTPEAVLAPQITFMFWWRPVPRLFYCIAWYCMLLNCIRLYCMALHTISLYSFVLYGIACYFIVLHGTA